jgi:Cu(I)/Ag(I) efflux system membrane fusion protein
MPRRTVRRRRVALATLAAAALVALWLGRARLVAWFTGGPVGDTTAGAVAASAGGLTIAAALDPDPPRPLGESLVLTIRDAAGQPVDDAEVTVASRMPAMGSMPAMRSEAKVRRENAGRYRAEFDLPMAGTWQPEVAVRSPRGAATVRYSLTTGSKGLVAVAAEAGDGPAVGAAVPRGMPQGAGHRDEPPAGVVTLDDGRQQEIGLRTGVVTRQRLGEPITTIGRVAYDESRLHDVSVKFAGWIGTLYVDQTGQSVRRGQVLLTLYSPDLYGAEQEYLAALASQRAAQASAAPDRADYLVEAARQKLLLWDLDDGEVHRLAARGAPDKQIPILSPAAGVVVEKNVVQGASVQSGMKLFRIADLDRVWVEAEVYEADLGRVMLGAPATVTVRALPGRPLHGRVTLVEPALAAESRTARVRIEVRNPRGPAGPALLPEMVADVELGGTGSESLGVPESAVLYTGPRTIVFVDEGGGRFRPREVRLGRKVGGMFEVVAGVSEGDRVVTSGTFLLDAESRLAGAGEGGS